MYTTYCPPPSKVTSHLYLPSTLYLPQPVQEVITVHHLLLICMYTWLIIMTFFFYSFVFSFYFDFFLFVVMCFFLSSVTFSFSSLLHRGNLSIYPCVSRFPHFIHSLYYYQSLSITPFLSTTTTTTTTASSLITSITASPISHQHHHHHHHPPPQPRHKDILAVTAALNS